MAKNIINKILFIGLSNIGDAVLTLPVLDYLRDQFPQAYLVAISGPRPKEIFEDRKIINELIVYDKHCSLGQKFELIASLRRKKFDAIVDLRNTAFPLIVPSRLRTPFTKPPKDIAHMKDRHFWRVKKMFKLNLALVPKRHFLVASKKDQDYVNSFLKNQQNNVVISAGARSHVKRWSIEGFVEVINKLNKILGKNVILVGDDNDKEIIAQIIEQTQVNILDLAGKINLKQLAFLISKSDLVLTNDSAVLHIASYVNKPIVALFGPTDFNKYGPWSSKSKIVHAANMSSIHPSDVFSACKEILINS